MKQTIHKTGRELTSQTTLRGGRLSGLRGGTMLNSGEYRIAGSTFTTKTQRGEFQSVAMLETGTCPERGIKPPVRASQNISVDPPRIPGKAGEADVRLRMAAGDNTALGANRASVRATPERRCAMARPKT